MSSSDVTVAYVAGPYRDPRGPFYVDRNVQAARSVAAHVWQHGWAAITPHLNTAHFDGMAPDDHFLAGTMEILRRCDCVVMVPDWIRSEGSRSEVLCALDRDMPVLEFPCLSNPTDPSVLRAMIAAWEIDHPADMSQ